MNTPIQPEPFPMHLIDVPGFIGDVIKFNLSTATRPQPILALGAAIALQAVLAGRKVRDERGNRTNLYIVGIAKSSAGKEHARQVNKKILNESGNGELEGSEDFASKIALFNEVKRKPAVLIQPDDFHKYLAAAASESNRRVAFDIVKLLRRLALSTGSMHSDTNSVGLRFDNKIIQPCVSIYGTALPGQYQRSFTRVSLEGDFLSQLFIFENSHVHPYCQPNNIDIPEAILERARYWGDYKTTAGNLQHIDPEPTRVITTPEAKAAFRAFGASFEVRMIQQGNEIEGSIWGRAVEKAMRLALVCACSRDPGHLEIIESDAAWACELSAYLTRRMMHTASRAINDSHNDKTRSNCLSCRNDIEGVGNRKSAIDMHEQFIHAHITQIKKSFHQLELHQKMLFELIRSENT